MRVNEQDFEAAQSADLRALNYSWEQFNLKIQEFQLSCRYGNWSVAEAARVEALDYIEANFDAFAAIYRRCLGC